MGTVSAATTTFTDGTATPGTAYFYTVKALSPLASSVASNEATATIAVIAPGPPTGLTAVAGIASITLNWTPPTNAGNSPLTGYQIFRGTTPGGNPAPPSAPPTTATTFTDNTATPGVAYFYTVKALNPLPSIPSNEATATIAVIAPGRPPA